MTGKRSAAARKGWETRRANAAAAAAKVAARSARSVAARKGWETRRNRALEQLPEDERENAPEDRVIWKEGTHAVQGWQDLYKTGAQPNNEMEPGETITLHDKIRDAWLSVPEERRAFGAILIKSDLTGGWIRTEPTGDIEEFLVSIRAMMYNAGIRRSPGFKIKAAPETVPGGAELPARTIEAPPEVVPSAEWRIELAPPAIERTPEELARLARRRELHAEQAEQRNARARERHAARREIVNEQRRERYRKLRSKNA